MPFKALLSIGNIFVTPETLDGESMEFVIAYDPWETSPDIKICFLYPGRVKKSWQVAYGRKKINCWETRSLSEAELRKCTHVGSLDEAKINLMQNALHYAKIYKMMKGGY